MPFYKLISKKVQKISSNPSWSAMLPLLAVVHACPSRRSYTQLHTWAERWARRSWCFDLSLSRSLFFSCSYIKFSTSGWSMNMTITWSGLNPTIHQLLELLEAHYSIWFALWAPGLINPSSICLSISSNSTSRCMKPSDAPMPSHWSSWLVGTEDLVRSSRLDQETLWSLRQLLHLGHDWIRFPSSRPQSWQSTISSGHIAPRHSRISSSFANNVCLPEHWAQASLSSLSDPSIGWSTPQEERLSPWTQTFLHWTSRFDIWVLQMLLHSWWKPRLTISSLCWKLIAFNIDFWWWALGHPISRSDCWRGWPDKFDLLLHIDWLPSALSPACHSGWYLPV